MALKISVKANKNYLAKVVQLNNLRKHPNADRLQAATIDGNVVYTDINAKDGQLYVYFPLESAINKEYLSFSNCFEDKTLNVDKDRKGYFQKTGRVRATRLRGEKSEGYIAPVFNVNEWLAVKGISFQITEEHVGVEFDVICDVLLCEKYINRDALLKAKRDKKTNNTKKVARVSRLIEDQFHFHIDTPQLKKLVHEVDPNDYISITRKLHGTSAVISRVLCVKPLKWYEKLLKRIGINIVDTQYDLIYSSRKVVKNGYMDPADANYNHYYSSDIWGDCAKKYDACLKTGVSLYGEIVGYTKDGAPIQKGYDYGCKHGEFDFYVYRATITSATGDVYELSPLQMKSYCSKYGIKTVPEIYYGKAKDFYDLDVNEHWHQNFLQRLSDDYLEKDCDMCQTKVPDEGICLRVDKPLDIQVYKLKSFRFFEYETKMLDKGVIDMETLETESAD